MPTVRLRICICNANFDKKTRFNSPCWYISYYEMRMLMRCFRKLIDNYFPSFFVTWNVLRRFMVLIKHVTITFFITFPHSHAHATSKSTHFSKTMSLQRRYIILDDSIFSKVNLLIDDISRRNAYRSFKHFPLLNLTFHIKPNERHA